MFALLARYGDGFTYESSHILAVFDDEDVAKLVAEELGRKSAKAEKSGLFRDFPNHGFTVAPVQTFKAQSEARVRGIVEDLLRTHFQR